MKSTKSAEDVLHIVSVLFVSLFSFMFHSPKLPEDKEKAQTKSKNPNPPFLQLVGWYQRNYQSFNPKKKDTHTRPQRPDVKPTHRTLHWDSREVVTTTIGV